MRSRNLLLILGLAAALLLVGFLTGKLRFASAAAQQPPEATQQFTQQSNPTAQANETAIKTVSGIEVRASNFRIQNGMFVADICFELPDEGDWLIGLRSVLKFNEREAPLYTSILIDQEYAEDGEATHRCDWVGFLLEGDTSISDFTITIPRLETSAPDGYDCESAQQKLDAAHTGIVVSCYEDESSYGYSILQKPDGLSTDEANLIVMDAFIETLDGPWVLEGSLN